MPIYAVNVPVANYQQVALCAYHFVSFCAQYPIVYTAGGNYASSIITESNFGVTNAASPSRLFCSNAIFTSGHVGKYVAVRDPNNPSNTAIVKITAYISATEVQCNAPVANFTISATGVSFRIFDINVTPSPGNFFVFTNRQGSFPTWQTACRAESGTSTVSYEVGPTGGFDLNTGLWSGVVTPSYYGWSTVAQAFFAADPTQGWYATWTEDVGGPSSLINATLLGTMGSTHATAASGFPADATYAGIFGTASAPIAHNLDRSTTSGSSNQFLSTGHMGNEDGSAAVEAYMLTRTTPSGVDVLTLASAMLNPRTGVIDDYDIIIGHRNPRSVRGFVPGLRFVNDTVGNRTLCSSGATYVLGDGFAIVWNGKAAA